MANCHFNLCTVALVSQTCLIQCSLPGELTTDRPLNVVCQSPSNPDETGNQQVNEHTSPDMFVGKDRSTRLLLLLLEVTVAENSFDCMASAPIHVIRL